MLFSTMSPAFATTIEITGNGSDTNNTATVSTTQTTVVTQTNEANIDNNVSANSNTGGNDANRNTGGAVSVDTGDAKTLVGVSNTVNSNTADVDNCNCDMDADVLISGNGDGSRNNANLDMTNTTQVAQTNDADIDNRVDANSNTGKNDANRNTGGDVEVVTGNAWTGVWVDNLANSNWARVGGNSNSNGSVSLRILDNGADTRNNIALALDRDVLLQQYNSADVDNDVDAKASTGYNEANRNTGGEVSVDTGDAKTKVGVDNAVNFNWADVSCDCLVDVLAKVSGNGDESRNSIKATLTDDLNVFQDNACERLPQGLFSIFDFGRRHKSDECLDNEVDAYSGTGYNDANSNTGDPGSDPSVMTGNAESEVGIENTANANVFGSLPEDDQWPHNEGSNVNVNITFDLSDLLAALGITL